MIEEEDEKIKELNIKFGIKPIERNIKQNLDILPENNTNSKNEHELFIDSKYSYINSYTNKSNKNNKDIPSNKNDKRNSKR